MTGERTNRGRRLDVLCPNLTKGDEEQLLSGVVQGREEILLSIRVGGVELGFPRAEGLYDTRVTNVLSRGTEPVVNQDEETRREEVKMETYRLPW